MFRNYLYLIMLAAVVCLLGLIAYADEIQVPITSHALISNNQGKSNVLVSIPLPPQVNDSNLVFAQLAFPITPQLAGDSILRIDCFRVTATWNSQNVSWTSPWRNPGGDYDTSAAPIMFTTATPDLRNAYFDITNVVKSWLTANRQNHGLIFVVPNNIESRFAPNSAPSSPNNSLGTLKILIR